MTSNVNLKCSLAPAQIADRLKYRPSIIELQLFAPDLTEPNRIIETIGALKAQGVRVYLHHPMTVQGRFLDILSPDPAVAAYYRTSSLLLDEICQRCDVLCVVHPHYSKCESGHIDGSNRQDLLARTEALREALRRLNAELSGRFLWENAPCGLFSTENPHWISEIMRPLNLPVCYDISHAFMGLRGDNQATRLDLVEAFPFTRYYHVVDSVGSQLHDALELGQGAIRWQSLKSYILQRDFIFEIDLKNYEDCTPMIRSCEYFEALPPADGED